MVRQGGPGTRGRSGVARAFVLAGVTAAGACVSAGGGDDDGGDDDPGPGTCDPLDAATCAGETICLRGACVAAFGRTYDIVAYEAIVPQFKPDGSTWDAFGGAPDPFAVLSLNGTVLGQTSTIQDTFTPRWNEYVSAVIPAGSTLRVDLWDEDVSADDAILSCAASPLTADALHVGRIRCAGAAGEVTILFATR